jgi:hypothetical protein
MKKIRNFILILTFILLLFAILYTLFISQNSAFSKFSGFKNFEKNNFGGTVINTTSHDIKISDWRTVRVLPSGQSSKNLGVFDVDSIIIEKPTRFEENVYNMGVIKICDFANIIITSDGMYDYITSEGLTPLCKIARDYGYYPNLNTAFPYSTYSVKH